METDESKKSPSLKVLLVEDSEHDRTAFRRAFKKAEGSYELVEFERAEEALATLSVNPSQFDILVTDYMLPGMNGLELCRELLKKRTTIPMVILTGTGSEQIAVEALKAGVDDYIVKDPGQGYLKLLPHVIRDVVQKYLNRQKREQAEAELLEYMERQRTILSTAMDGFWIVDTAGRFLEVNETYCRMSGYAEHELLRTGISAVEDVENAADTAAHMQKVMAEGQDRFESRHRRKDGSVFDVEVSVQYRTTDEPTCVVFIRDITERKKAESVIKQNEENLRLMTDTMQETLSVIDLDGTFLYANQNAVRNMTGGKSDGIVGKNIGDLIQKEQADSLIDRYRLVYQTGEPYHQEVEVSLAKGDKWFSNTLQPIDFGSPAVPAILSVSFDITERKQMEAKLQQAQKIESIGTLAGGIAHDFNNILFPIIGMAEMLLEDLPQKSLEYKNIQEILKAGHRGRDLVKQILAFSRQSNQKKIPTRGQTVLQEVLKLSRSTIPSNIVIKQDIQSDSGIIMADPTQIHQIAMNLITNAYHAADDTGGRISIVLREKVLQASDKHISDLAPGKYLLFSVSDDGHGISQENMNRIFDPYFTTKEQGKGTGLGLAVVRGIVVDHGGAITVDSELGKGSTFNVYLPLMAQTDRVERFDAIKELPVGNERILLVDDEEPVTKLVKQMLERLGYNVTATNSSTDALKLFKDNKNAFDIVITDMTMPNMNGDRLANDIISIKPGIPIILCTGFSERLDRETAAAIGIKGFLMKPVAKAEMAKTVRKVLDAAKIENHD